MSKSKTNGHLHDERQVGTNAAPDMGQATVDVSEKIEHDRLQAIGEARKHVSKIRHNTQTDYLKGTLSSEKAAILTREALEAYLIELKPYATVDEVAKSYWFGKEDRTIGTIEIHPPAGHAGDPKVVDTIEALDDILRAPAIYSEEYTKTTETRHGPNLTEVTESMKPIPRDVITVGIEWANSFARYVGLDIDPETDTDEWEV